MPEDAEKQGKQQIQLQEISKAPSPGNTESLALSIMALPTCKEVSRVPFGAGSLGWTQNLPCAFTSSSSVMLRGAEPDTAPTPATTYFLTVNTSQNYLRVLGTDRRAIRHIRSAKTAAGSQRERSSLWARSLSSGPGKEIKGRVLSKGLRAVI